MKEFALIDELKKAQKQSREESSELKRALIAARVLVQHLTPGNIKLLDDFGFILGYRKFNFHLYEMTVSQKALRDEAEAKCDELLRPGVLDKDEWDMLSPA